MAPIAPRSSTRSVVPRRLLRVFGVALVLALTTGTAMAGTTTRKDARGDVRARFDMTAARYVNSTETFAVVVHVRNLRAVPALLFIKTTIGFRNYIGITAERRANGRVATSMFASVDTCEPPCLIPCEVTAEWRLAKNAIRVAVPQSCLREVVGHRGVRLQLSRPDVRGRLDVIAHTKVPYG